MAKRMASRKENGNKDEQSICIASHKLKIDHATSHDRNIESLKLQVEYNRAACAGRYIIQFIYETSWEYFSGR